MRPSNFNKSLALKLKQASPFPFPLPLLPSPLAPAQPSHTGPALPNRLLPSPLGFAVPIGFAKPNGLCCAKLALLRKACLPNKLIEESRAYHEC